MGERFLVGVDRDQASGLGRVEVARAEAVAAAQLEYGPAGAQGERAEDAAFDEPAAAEPWPLVLGIKLVVEPLRGGPQRALELVLHEVRRCRERPNAAVEPARRRHEQVVEE